MSTTFKIRFVIEQEDAFTEQFDGPVTLGRQRSPEDGYLLKSRDDNGWRVAIAPRSDNTVSREHVLINPVGDDRIQITNVSSNNYFYLEEATKLEIPPKASIVRELPIKLSFGKVHATLISDAADGLDHLATIAARELEPLQVANELAAAIANATSSIGERPDPTAAGLKHWLPALRLLLERAPTRDEFFNQALSTVLDFVDLDWTAVLLYQPEIEVGRPKRDSWVEVAARLGKSAPRPAPQFFASRKILEKVLQQKNALVRDSNDIEFDPSYSQRHAESIVVAPIIGEHGAVLGAVYGQRMGKVENRYRPPISDLEKDLVRTIAAGIGLGLMWQTQAHAATAAEVRFSQFFGPHLAATLRAQPHLMEGREANVTLMFCDIRGFSAISHELGDPARTVEWLSDVMEDLSHCVLESDGVLVDYIGDELLAMWGAPMQQPDHAHRACQAALKMRERLPHMNARWNSRLGRDFQLGIGLNSGPAFVGNTGTQFKLKYGPLGPHVNLASRVQGATKYFNTDILITEDTRLHLPADLPTRRICSVRVVNIPKPVVLYQVWMDDDESWNGLRTEYEAALTEFESMHFHRAVRILGNILAEHPTDGPSLALLSRVTTQLVHPDQPFDPVWELPGK